MPYTPEHKARTRDRILDAAREQFLAHGYNGVGIVGIMKAADLTQGAFYGHFTSKDALFAEVVGAELGFHTQLRNGLRATPEDPLGVLQRAIDYYLGADGKPMVGDACPLTALAADIARAPAPARAAFARSFRLFAKKLTATLAAAPTAETGRTALALIALLVGGVTLARATDDAEAAAAIVDACRTGAARLTDIPDSRDVKLYAD